MQYEIAAILILLAFSAFFSGSETALFSLSHIKARKFQSDKRARPRLVATLLSHPRRLLITLLIGNMLVNIFASTLSASLFRKTGAFGNVSDVISVLVMTTLILIFGEIAPKTYAIQHTEKMALAVAPLVNAFSVVVRPIRIILKSVADAIISVLTRAVKAEQTEASEGELKLAVKLGVTQGLLDSQEEAMIHGLFEIETGRVREMMKSRAEIFSLELSTPTDQIRAAFVDKKYTRVPVHSGDIDNVLGLLYAKDLLFASPAELEKSGIRPLLRPVYFVPETMPANRLLKEFRARATHFALVVDEYGSISGLITMEDVLQSLIGKLGVAERLAGEQVRFHEDTGVVSARMPISEFNDLLSAAITDELNVTIGGFLTHEMGKIPQAGEVFETDDIRFEIKKASKNRIEEVLVQRKAPRTEE